MLHLHYYKATYVASDCKAGESGEALATDLDFLFRNLKSRGPSLVQAKGFRATIVLIRFVNKAALHWTKKKTKQRAVAGLTRNKIF